MRASLAGNIFSLWSFPFFRLSHTDFQPVEVACRNPRPHGLPDLSRGPIALYTLDEIRSEFETVCMARVQLPHPRYFAENGGPCLRLSAPYSIRRRHMAPDHF